MKKSLLTFILIVCMLFSLTACSNELEPIEGKYYFTGNSLERESDEYVELFLDGTYNMFLSWKVWWEDDGTDYWNENRRHDKINGKYKVFKGTKETNHCPYIIFYYPTEVIESKYWSKYDTEYVLFIRSDTILSEYADRYLGNYVKA